MKSVVLKHSVGTKPSRSANQQTAFVQPKLMVNAPNDVYEQEADAVADRVMRMPLVSSKTQGTQGMLASSVQRKCAHCEEEEKKKTPIMRKAESGGGFETSPTFSSQLSNTKGGGRILPNETKAFMESRFSRDFSNVRVHTDGQAANMNQDIQAKAFTHESDIYFNRGQFAPNTEGGQRLLAHELVHVVQNMSEHQSHRLQCYEAPEHQDFGDSALGSLEEFMKTSDGAGWAKKYNLDAKALAALPNDPMLKGGKFKVGKNRTVEVTVGDIIALMGDLYRSPDALISAPDEEIKELLEAMKRERAGELDGGKANAVYQDITSKYRPASDTFIELAKINAPHFTPTNRAAWKELHLSALKKANQSRLLSKEGPSMFQEALIYDAAGGHFLTDAFAAGHLFDKKKLENAIIVYLQQNPARPENPEVQLYYTLMESQGVTHQLVLKNIHDRLNTEGVEVTNKKGMKWRTYGDNYLKNAQETSRIGALAVYMSRWQVMQAGDKSIPPNLSELEQKTDEVLDLLPDDQSVERVTDLSITYIPQAVKDLTSLIYRQRLTAAEGLKAMMIGDSKSRFVKGLASVTSSIIKSNLETVTSPGRLKQLLDIQESARKFDMPLVAPQFTILSWP